MQALSFSFENNAVRTLGTADLPLFVAIDVATALGYKNTKDAVLRHVDSDDLIKSEIADKLNRIQTVNCVNESGLYALIFGSKLESAKRFKRWVTSEVLPAIRKNGHYEVSTASNTLSSEEQYEIRKAVKSRAKNSSIHYQTIYNALYDYFKIASYKDLTKGQLQAALTFIHTCELKPQLRECQDFCVWGGYSRGSPTRLPFVFEMQYARPDAIAGAKVEGPARSAGGSSLAPAIARREAAGALAREV